MPPPLLEPSLSGPASSIIKRLEAADPRRGRRNPYGMDIPQAKRAGLSCPSWLSGMVHSGPGPRKTGRKVFDGEYQGSATVRQPSSTTTSARRGSRGSDAQKPGHRPPEVGPRGDSFPDVPRYNNVNIMPILTGSALPGWRSLAAQNIIRDFLNGIFVVVEDHFSVGDVVKIGEYFGVVENFTSGPPIFRPRWKLHHHPQREDHRTVMPPSTGPRHR